MYGLEEKRKILNEYIAELSDEKAKKKPSEDSWSMLEILEHLYLMEGFIAQKIDEVIKNSDVQTAESKPIERTTNRSHKVEAPEGHSS